MSRKGHFDRVTQRVSMKEGADKMVFKEWQENSICDGGLGKANGMCWGVEGRKDKTCLVTILWSILVSSRVFMSQIVGKEAAMQDAVKGL